jgi:6-pyruvoyltetrahydropterin/6-carboxytetrahydropterin synthase
VYELTVKCHFDAAHSLRGYPGECYRLHGHTWDVEATVAGTELDEIGILYDFKLLKADLNQVLERYDHFYMNEIPPFTEISPTAENLARVIYEQLAEVIAPIVTLLEISVWESPVAKLTYRP